MKLILCVFVALLSFGIKASAAPDPNFHVYLCFGQSNMESGGKMDEMGLHHLRLQPGRRFRDDGLFRHHTRNELHTPTKAPSVP
jgi:hypothetical protein